MSDFYLGEIRLFGFGFAPKNWAICDGKIMQVAQNQALFSLIGGTYGGDGRTTFALPDFRGRVPVGPNYTTVPWGKPGGVENVTLTKTQVPTHTHAFNVNTTAGTANTPGKAASGTTPAVHNYLSSANTDSFEKMEHNVYGAFTAPGVALNAGSISNAGGNQPHNNIQPSAVLNFCIATAGLFPTRQ